MRTERNTMPWVISLVVGVLIGLGSPTDGGRETKRVDRREPAVASQKSADAIGEHGSDEVADADSGR